MKYIWGIMLLSACATKPAIYDLDLDADQVLEIEVESEPSEYSIKNGCLKPARSPAGVNPCAN